MGEIIAAALLASIIAIGLFIFFVGARHNRSLQDRPVPTLGLHDEDTIFARATAYYRLNQRSVRLLERLQLDISVSGMMSAPDRKEAQAIIDEFYK